MATKRKLLAKAPVAMSLYDDLEVDANSDETAQEVCSDASGKPRSEAPVVEKKRRQESTKTKESGEDGAGRWTIASFSYKARLSLSFFQPTFLSTVWYICLIDD